MNVETARRVRNAAAGAAIGGLLAIALDALGVTGVLKMTVNPAIAFVLAGAALALTRLRAVLWIASGATVFAALVVMYTPIVSVLVRPMVRRDAMPAKLDAVVVLSGGLTSDGMMGQETLDRILSGAELAREGKTGALVLSREESFSHGRALSDSVDQANIIRLTGISVPVIFIDSATSTRDEALLTQKALAGKSLKKIGVVTSPMHTRRACATFERVGFDVTCIPSAYREAGLQHLDEAGDRVHAFGYWIYELAGTLKYRSEGWMR